MRNVRKKVPHFDIHIEYKMQVLYTWWYRKWRDCTVYTWVHEYGACVHSVLRPKQKHFVHPAQIVLTARNARRQQDMKSWWMSTCQPICLQCSAITINSVVLSVKWELLLNYFHPDPIKIFFKSYFSQGTYRVSNNRRPSAKIFKGRYFDYLIFPIISPRVYQEILNFKKRASLWKPCS